MPHPLFWPKAIFFTHLAATWMMVGTIWYVQVVHYPLFKHVGKELFIHYHKKHLVHTYSVVGIPMFIEIVTAILLVWFRLPGITALQVWLNLIVLIFTWGSTIFIHIPQQLRLKEGFNHLLLNKMTLFNWVRTIAWTLRGVLMIWIVDTILLRS